MASSAPIPKPTASCPIPATTTLPPLTPSEFKEYNRLADMMELYHNHFRQIWNTLHNAASAGSRPPHLSLKGFIDEGLLFVRMLTAHHGIEEAYLYPQLQGRMEEFRVHEHEHDHDHGREVKAEVKEGSEADAKDAETAEGKAEPEYPPDLIGQHRAIHAGMDEFEAYLRACKKGEKELTMPALKEQMDSWGGVLWRHLDEEVVALGAENMRRHWTLQEMRAIGI